MRPWIKRTLLGLFGAGIAVGGLTACGGYHHGPGGKMSPEEVAQMREKIIERISKKLDLNAQQKQRLAVLADKLKAQRAALAGNAADPRAEVQALVAGDRFDRARAQSLVSEKTAVINAGSPEVIAAMADFYDSLDATQQQQVREFLQKRRGGWRGH
ncbi:Spy/CpxP family protein refolding chaperone [Cupriavidus sp. 30B13]|uniref:Spy/CpxP family protein refolding chaperone n=1 Tax=Cupriavidus sp. 30B13 TaxID=3384241 RepID=UPI003B8EB294